jgi:hypothetical protein
MESTAVGGAMTYGAGVTLQWIFGAAATTPIGWVAVAVVAVATGIHCGRVMYIGSRLYSEQRVVRPLNESREQLGMPKVTHR